MAGCSAFGGYIAGIATTIVVMNVFEAAQPALLYIVPAVLGAVGLHAYANRQFKQVAGLACSIKSPTFLHCAHLTCTARALRMLLKRTQSL